ncbi:MULTISPECIES: hypothetical protein [Paenibacillus]|nr:hypothetical protein [Paenibacillus odorifer]
MGVSLTDVAQQLKDNNKKVLTNEDKNVLRHLISEISGIYRFKKENIY